MVGNLYLIKNKMKPDAVLVLTMFYLPKYRSYIINKSCACITSKMYYNLFNSKVHNLSVIAAIKKVLYGPPTKSISLLIMMIKSRLQFKQRRRHATFPPVIIENRVQI